VRRVSKRRQEWLDKYHAQIEQDDWVQECEVCGLRASKNALQRHHPRRRLGKNILYYIYVCYICHEEIEKGRHPEFLPRDNSHERKFHSLKPEQNMLKEKTNEDKNSNQ
jgi:ribosomal protein L24E